MEQLVTLRAENLKHNAVFVPELNDGEEYWRADKELTEQDPYLQVEQEIAYRLVGAYPRNLRIHQTQSVGHKEIHGDEIDPPKKAPINKPEGKKAAPGDLQKKMAEKYENKGAAAAPAADPESSEADQ